jgi:lipopolysaccharide transport system permease protein
MMVWYQFLPGWQILLLPVFILVPFLDSFGHGLWLTALIVKYRLLYSLDPMAGVTDGFRWGLLGAQPPSTGRPSSSASRSLLSSSG